MSSPPTPKNPPKPHQPNHIIHLKSWHSSYASLATIKVWINSIKRSGNRPLAPLFLNRISRTESISYPQLPHGTSFWRSPRSRHSGEAQGVVILAKPESPYWLFLRRCTFRRTEQAALNQYYASNSQRINLLPPPPVPKPLFHP